MITGLDTPSYRLFDISQSNDESSIRDVLKEVSHVHDPHGIFVHSPASLEQDRSSPSSHERPESL
jgi:hypothetical protein